MACALLAAVMPAPPAAMPFSTASANFPWWNSRQASWTARARGNGSQSPRCSFAQLFFRLSPAYTNDFDGWANAVHFSFGMAIPSFDVGAAQPLDVAARLCGEIWSDQHHHLVCAAPRVGGIVAAAAQCLEIEPVGGHEQHVAGERVDLLVARAKRSLRCQAIAQALDGRELSPGDAIEALAQAPVAARDAVQVAVEEAEVPDSLEHEVQVEPEVLDRLRRIAIHARLDVQALLEAAEELGDDLVLVAVVVVEIAGADAQRGGDVRGGDAFLAMLVEEPQALVQDPAPCALGAHRVAVLSGHAPFCAIQVLSWPRVSRNSEALSRNPRRRIALAAPSGMGAVRRITSGRRRRPWRARTGASSEARMARSRRVLA